MSSPPSYRSGVFTGLLVAALLGGGGYGAWRLWYAPPPDAKKSAPPSIPAVVAKPLKEDQLNTVVLTAKAEELLALQVAPLEKKKLPRQRTYAGEVIVPPGDAITVTAPCSGVLQAGSASTVLPGQLVEQGQRLFELLPLLTPEGRANLATTRVDTEGQVKNAETQLEAVTIALNRAKQLQQDGAGSVRQVEEAQALVDLSRKTLEAAKARRDLLTSVIGQMDRGTAAPLAITAPVAGMLRSLNARAGQTVSTGVVLFELFNPKHLWVRVPVYVGEVKELQTIAAASVQGLSDKPGSGGQVATAVVAPPSANALAGTLDLYYRLDAGSMPHSPGERVSITIDLNEPAETLVVPWSAIVHDVYGGAWVYEKTVEHTFVRQRVIVRYVKENMAALSQGPAVGSRIVTAGAAELFGTETGFSK